MKQVIAVAIVSAFGEVLKTPQKSWKLLNQKGGTSKNIWRVAICGTHNSVSYLIIT